MLMEIIKTETEDGKELKVNLKRKTYGDEQKTLTVFPGFIITDLLNSNQFLSKTVNKFSDGASYSNIKDAIHNSELGDDTKELLFLFNDVRNYKIFNTTLLRANKFLADIKKVCLTNGLKSKDIIRYIEYKYRINTINSISAINEEFFYDFYMPVIHHYNIDVGEFAKYMQSTKRTGYEDLLNWIKQYITNESHYELFEKLMEKNVKRINDDEFLLSLPMEQLIDYLKMEDNYKINCKIFRFWHIDEFLILSYIQLLKNGFCIKKCPLCNKFFVATNGNAKYCSENCKDTGKDITKQIREEKDAYNKIRKTIKNLRDKLTRYEGVCKEIGPKNKEYPHRQNILTAFKFTYIYYCWVCNKVSDVILNDTDSILNDKNFITDLYNWLDIVSSQTCDIKNTSSMSDVKYYKFSRDGFFEFKSCLTLLANEEFILEIDEKFSDEGELVKKSETEKYNDKLKLGKLRNKSTEKS